LHSRLDHPNGIGDSGSRDASNDSANQNRRYASIPLIMHVALHVRVALGQDRSVSGSSDGRSEGGRRICVICAHAYPNKYMDQEAEAPMIAGVMPLYRPVKGSSRESAEWENGDVELGTVGPTEMRL